jgi:hypothetical protein
VEQVRNALSNLNASNRRSHSASPFAAAMNAHEDRRARTLREPLPAAVVLQRKKTF